MLEVTKKLVNYMKRNYEITEVLIKSFKFDVDDVDYKKTTDDRLVFIGSPDSSIFVSPKKTEYVINLVDLSKDIMNYFTIKAKKDDKIVEITFHFETDEINVYVYQEGKSSPYQTLYLDLDELKKTPDEIVKFVDNFIL